MSDSSEHNLIPNKEETDSLSNGEIPTEFPPVPTEGVLLGIDHGKKRLGLAVCDAGQKIAAALENYTRCNSPQDKEFLKGIIQENRIAGVVVGLPVHMSGDEGGQAILSRNFGRWIANFSSLNVVYWDERYTSAIADMYLGQAGLSRKKRKERRDKIAAQIMLQSFLDSSDRTGQPVSYRK